MTDMFSFSDEIDAFCFINKNASIYDLNPLHSEKVDYKLNGLDDGLLYLNICKDAVTKCGNKTGMAVYKKGGSCNVVAGKETVVSKFKILKRANETVVKVDLPEGEVCIADPNQNYMLSLELTCDENVEGIRFDKPNSFKIKSCSNTITARTKHSCPHINYYGLWKALTDNKILFGLMLMIVGGFLCFFGKKFIFITQIIAGVLFVMAISLYLIFNFVQIEINTWMFWFIIIVCVLLGVGAGFVLSKVEWLPALILGGLAGGIAGLIVYNLFLKYISSPPAVVIFWACIIIGLCVGATLSLLFANHVIIISTATIGSYCLIRGLSFLLGSFPDERQVYDLLSKKEYTQFKKLCTWHVYLYIILMLIACGLGIFVQYKFFNQSSEESKSKNKDNAAAKATEKPEDSEKLMEKPSE